MSRVVAATIRQTFDQPDRASAGETWRRVADKLRTRWPKLAELMDESQHDVLAYMTFPRQHRTKLHSTNSIKRLNKATKRRADDLGTFRNEASFTCLIGAVPFEQNDEWLTASRHDTVGVAPLIRGLEFSAMLADKAFDRNWIIDDLNQRGAKIVISWRPQRKTPLEIEEAMCKWQHLIQCYYQKLQESKRIAMRSDKTDSSYGAMINQCCAVIISI